MRMIYQVTRAGRIFGPYSDGSGRPSRDGTEHYSLRKAKAQQAKVRRDLGLTEKIAHARAESDLEL